MCAMKLRYSPTSPFVRKVCVTALETGLYDRIERIPINVYLPSTDIASDNPLGKVPALITEGGEVLYDSPVICEYLDTLHDGLKLFPPPGGARWTALRQQALGDGILDAGVLKLLEERRPENEQSPAWITKQTAKLARGLDALEDEAEALSGPITIGHIAIGCALGWLEFRFADEHDHWRNNRTSLAHWYENFAQRPSMQDTVPREAS